MDTKRNNYSYYYYVVEFSKPPYRDIDQYVCIPNSWIKLHITKDQIVTKYPVEKLSITKKRVKSREECSDDWAIYVAEVKYGTNYYNEAKRFISYNKKSAMERRYSDLPKKDAESSSLLEKLLISKGNNPSSLNIKHPNESVTPSNSNIASVVEQRKTNPKIVIHRLPSNSVETIHSSDGVTKPMGTSSKILNSNQLVSTWEINSDKVTSTQKICNDKSNKIDSIENNNSHEVRTTNKSYVSNYCPDTTNGSDLMLISDQNPDTDNTDVLKKMCDSMEDTLSIFEFLDTGFIQNCRSIEKLLNLINEYHYVGSYNPIDITLKENAAPVVEENNHEEEIVKKRQLAKRTYAEIGVIKRREVQRYEEEEEEGNNDNKEVKRKRHVIRRLSLPPESYENNAKWTLRYTEPTPELVELLENTGVYINTLRLINCKRIANDPRYLIQLLLPEIFTDCALSICSLTGAQANSFDYNGSSIRPGLDKNARIVLEKYVKQYAKKNKWHFPSTKFIATTIRNKLRDMRLIHRCGMACDGTYHVR